MKKKEHHICSPHVFPFSPQALHVVIATFCIPASVRGQKKIYMGASAKDPPLKLTSMLIGISLIKILVFYKIFFLNELRVKFLSSLKKKSVKNSE